MLSKLSVEKEGDDNDEEVSQTIVRARMGQRRPWPRALPFLPLI